MGVLGLDTVELDGCRAVRTVFKAARDGGGRGITYIGSITLPFRDFSYVIKIQCPEVGITGVRESAIMAERLSRGLVQVKQEALGKVHLRRSWDLEGWLVDLDDQSAPLSLRRNVSEDPIYDSRFPDHPLSRARRFLERVQRTIRIGDDIRSAPTFTHSAERRKLWKLR